MHTDSLRPLNSSKNDPYIATQSPGSLSSRCVPYAVDSEMELQLKQQIISNALMGATLSAFCLGLGE